MFGIGGLVLIFILFVGYSLLTTRKHSPADTATYQGANGLEISVKYCRPFKKERKLFGEGEGVLVPYGKKWRTGANEATEITFNQNVKIVGEAVPAGTYSLYTIPGPDQWTVAINKKTGYWGAGFSDPFEESQDVVRASAKVSQSSEEMEQFTISFSEQSGNAIMHLAWGNTQASLPIER